MMKDFNEFLNEGEGEGKKKERKHTPDLKFYGHRNERDGQIYYNAIYSSPFGTKMHGAGDIYELTFIIMDDKEIDKEPIEYWGWLTDDNKVTMIFPVYFLFNMCFPSGAKHAEETRDGERVKLELVDEKIYNEKKDEGTDKKTK